jgi:hypothetical protein
MRRSRILETRPYFFGGCMKSETVYRRYLINKLKDMFPGCVILKNDPSELQGVPDILVLFKHMWAMLEIKLSSVASKQPNQDYYIEEFGRMSYASFINPQNEDEVLNDLQLTFGVSRQARVS